MAIDINDVYEKVLAISNKEQRGYITPQEFNLFANNAQLEIFEQYFYDLNQQARVPGNDTVYADADDMLEEKLQIFEKTDAATSISSYTTIPGGFYVLPSYIYRINKIEYNDGTTTVDCDMLKTKDFNNCVNGGPLTRPNNIRPIANIRNNELRVIGGTTFNPNTPITPTSIIYFKKPTKPQWGYYVVGQKALYDPSPTKTTNFELHPSDENKLVYKILKYAGVSMRRDDLSKNAQIAETMLIQQEKQ